MSQQLQGVKGSPVVLLAEVYSEPATSERQLTFLTEELLLVGEPSVSSQVKCLMEKLGMMIATHTLLL